MKQPNQSGFAAVEAVLIFVVLAVLATCGYLFMQSRHSTALTKSASANSPITSSSTTEKDTTFDMSLADTYYSCIDSVNDSNGKFGGSIDTKTGDCRFNNTGGAVYKRPTSYSDDMLIGVKGFQFTASEVSEVRAIGKNLFRDCGGEARVQVFGEADGKYLSLGTQCGDGSNETLVLQGSTWKILKEGSVGISCKDITTYHIPANVLLHEGDHCAGSNYDAKISSLPGYENYGK